MSRISPMKNLDFLLRALSFVSIPIKLDIKGTKENLNYLQQCELLRNKLPQNVEVNFGDHVKHDEVNKIFKNYDLYVLPTRGENFGHAIFEAISNGLPAMISDKTPWRPDHNGGLEVVPLIEKTWATAIMRWAELDYSALYKKRQAALKYAHKYNLNNKTFENNEKLINSAIKNKL